jgi:outer membrane protein assembly factor BamA
MSPADSITWNASVRIDKSDFQDSISAINYLNRLPLKLHQKGFAAASIDRIEWVLDTIKVELFIGSKFQIDQVEVDAITSQWLLQTRFSDKYKKPKNVNDLAAWEELLLDHAADHGYPFAQVKLDSIQWNGNVMLAKLKLEKDVFYRFDSISILGNANAHPEYLYQLLQLAPGMPFSQKKINQATELLKQSPFFNIAQSPDLVYLATGAHMNLYIDQGKGNQFNALVGWQPASDPTGKAQFIGDVHLDLQHYFGRGERILFRWQQLQPLSPRLNIILNRPFLFNSAFGADVQFDFFKKDSSFLQWQARFGTGIRLNQQQQGNFFIQWQQASLLEGAIDTQQIRSFGKLPENADYQLSQLGFQWKWLTVNRRINPSKGLESDCNFIAGRKKIIPNTTILQIKGNGLEPQKLYDSIGTSLTQLKWKGNINAYFSLGKQIVLKTGIQTGWLVSPVLFRNEWFQLGGQQTLRGFDEESLYASGYAIGTLELRRLIGPLSYGAVFLEAAHTEIQQGGNFPKGNWMSGGLGLSYETKAGILNLSLATGWKIGDIFRFRDQLKLHVGIQNYF